MLERTSWIALRVRGGPHRLVPNDAAVYAHTSAVHCVVGDHQRASREDALYFVDAIDRLIAQVEAVGSFERPEHRAEVLELFRRGQEVYRRIAAAR